MTARFAAHNPPDVFYVDSSLASTWAEQGVLQPLNTLHRESKYDTSKFFPSLLERVQGGQAGLRLPEGLVAARDGDQHRHARRREAEGAEDLGRAAVGRAEARVVERRARRQADLPLARLGSAAGVRLPVQRLARERAVAGGAEAVNFYVGLLKSGLAATPDKLGSGWCGEALGKGKAAIIFEGNWLLPFMKTTYPKTRYGVFPMVKDKTGGNLAFTVSYSMAKDAKNKDAAWTLLRG